MSTTEKTKFDHQINPPTEPVDETDTTLGEFNLSEVTLPEGSAPFEQRNFRFRRVDVGPGGVVPWHCHANRPALLFIAQGEIVEYNSRHEKPLTRTAPKLVTEFGDFSHWWKNHGDEHVIIYAADLAESEGCPEGCC